MMTRTVSTETQPDPLRFFVTFHAVEQFQERAKDHLRERGIADDFATLKHLDGMCAEAEDAGRVEDFREQGRHTRVLDVSGKDFGRLYALLRPNESTNSSAEWAVITVLTGQMYDRSKRSGAWQPLPSSGLRVEYLKRVTPPALPEAVLPPSEPPAVPEMPEPAMPETPAAESFCVVWTDAAGLSQHCEGSREEVARRMEQAHAEGGRSFALYVAVPLQVKTVFVF